ncbi:MAG: molybdopterin molybdenumtransferase MoeA, partial [Oxalobacter sp.]|nr:molybdopterin molybdenumtransferase MoeA [Oxalobacter sp.]
VSVFVTCLLFVRPYLLKMQGVDAEMPSGYWLKSAGDYASSDDRREFLRAKLNADGNVELYPNQSSGVLSSLAWGDGLVDNPAGNTIQKGDFVKFIPFSAFCHP